MEGNGVRADSEQVASAPTGIRHTSSHRGILDIGPGDDHVSEIRVQSSRKLATRRASQAPGHPGASLIPTSHTRSVTPHIAADQRNVDRSVAPSPSSRRSVATRHHPMAEYVQAHGRGPFLSMRGRPLTTLARRRGNGRCSRAADPIRGAAGDEDQRP